MLTSKVAKRYAQGLLEFSQETHTTPTVFGEMQDVVKILNSSKELNSFFGTPFIEAKKKIEIASQIFASFSPSSRNLISLVIRHGRETHLKNIAQEYIKKVEDLQGIQRLTLTSATPLTDNNKREILAKSGLVQIDQRFDLETVINPEILGGYILRVGDQQVDASVRTKLNKLRKEFKLN